nr:hypothetical protein [Acidobacteriota bacterium]
NHGEHWDHGAAEPKPSLEMFRYLSFKSQAKILSKKQEVAGELNWGRIGKKVLFSQFFPSG